MSYRRTWGQFATFGIIFLSESLFTSSERNSSLESLESLNNTSAVTSNAVSSSGFIALAILVYIQQVGTSFETVIHLISDQPDQATRLIGSLGPQFERSHSLVLAVVGVVWLLFCFLTVQ